MPYHSHQVITHHVFNLSLRALVFPSPDGFRAIAIELPGVLIDAETRDEAMEFLKHAVSDLIVRAPVVYFQPEATPGKVRAWNGSRRVQECFGIDPDQTLIAARLRLKIIRPAFPSESFDTTNK